METLAPQPALSNAGTGCPKRLFQWIFAVTMLLACVLLFTRLGHYGLWDDESGDGLCAQSILQTGDTKGFVGYNIIGYHDGDLLAPNLRCEARPIMVSYMSALSMWVLGDNAFAARLPLALCGLGCIVLIFRWLCKWRASAVTVAVIAVALLANVSFFLYCRQCHYYGAAMFFAVAIGYLYVNWRGGFWRGTALGLSLAALMATNPCVYIAVCFSLLADYLIWQRKIRPFSFTTMAAVFVPSFFMGLAMVLWWNPFHCHLSSWMGKNSYYDRLVLFLWYWSDLNRAEMLLGLLLPFAIAAAFASHSTPLKRGLMALFVNVLAMSFLTNQVVSCTNCSDIRFLSYLIPLCFAIHAVTLCWLVKACGGKSWMVVAMAVMAFGTNTFYGGGSFLSTELRATPACFLGELCHPPGDPYTEASNWIRTHIQPGETIWVTPQYATGPLMFHAPAPLYSGQLNIPQEGPLAVLPPIYFQGKVPPDYVVAFGPYARLAVEEMVEWNKRDLRFEYKLAAVVNAFWKDLHRPELFWRSFVAIKEFNPNTDAIYFFKRVPRSATPAK